MDAAAAGVAERLRGTYDVGDGRPVPPTRGSLALALDWDCKVSIDTDAHAPGQLEWQAYGCDKAARHGIDAADIVNTWPVDDLLAWTASHAA